MPLLEDYETWLRQPFPSGIDRFGVDEFEVGYLCHSAAGCISTYLGDRRLEEAKVRILEQCLLELQQVISQLPPEDGGKFQQLAALCRRVLGIVGRRN
jgi:hypothetical protein